MKRLILRAGAAIALAIAAVRLANRALWMTPGERFVRRVFYSAIAAIGLIAFANLMQILTGAR